MQRSDFEAFREQMLINKELVQRALRVVVLRWRPELRKTPLDQFPAIAEETWERVTGLPVPVDKIGWEEIAQRLHAPIPRELDQAAMYRLARLVAARYAEQASKADRSKWLTVREAAERFAGMDAVDGLTVAKARSRINKAIRSGRLRSTRIDGRYHVDRIELDAWILQKRNQNLEDAR